MNLTKTLQTMIDGAIGLVSPTRALRRQLARDAAAAADKFSSYTGATYNRPRSNWTVSPGSADADLLPELDTLRERSRDLIRNDPHAASIAQSFVDNVVGNGIRPQSLATADEMGVSQDQASDIRGACELAWSRWAEKCDSTGHDDIYGIQALVARQLLTNGEVFVIPTMVEDVGRPYALALEVIEADRCESQNGADNPNGRANLRAGIELGRRGQPLAYWIRVSHPGDGIYERRTKRKWRRYAAKSPTGRPNILHLMNTMRPGQTRGVPPLSPALTAFRDLGSFMEATLIRERVSACFSMIVTTDDPYSAAISRADTTRNSQRINSLTPGTVEYLNPGESVQFGNPTTTGATFDPFVERNLRAIGASLGLPLELVTNDFSKTNYSSARAALLEARRMFGRHQRYLSTRFLQPIYEMLIEEAYLRGEIPIADFDRLEFQLTRTRWVPPGWSWVDPLKEVQASAAAIELGVSTLAEEAASQYGRDWEEIIEQRAMERRRQAEIEKAMGLAPANPEEEAASGEQ